MPETPPTVCKLGGLLASGDLDEQDADLLVQLLDGEPDERGRTVPATALATALRGMGHAVGPTTVKDHRGCRCACTRKDTTR